MQNEIRFENQYTIATSHENSFIVNVTLIVFFFFISFIFLEILQFS